MSPYSIDPTSGPSSGPAVSSPTATPPQQRLERALAHLVQPPGAINVAQADPVTSLDGSSGVMPNELVAPLERINAVMRSYGLEFDLQSYDSRVVTRVVDRESGEVIRQIPSEEILRIAENLAQMQGRLIELQA